MKYFTDPGNPDIDGIIKSADRRTNLSWLKADIRDGSKYCGWCFKNKLKGRQIKYCSEKCGISAYAFCNPQSEYGLQYLLNRQGWKCASCSYDYRIVATKLFPRWRGRYRSQWMKRHKEWGVSLMKGVKREAGESRKPEIDHVKAVALGGAGIGFSNHQVLCYQCHKAKTKRDMRKIREFKND